MLFLVGLCYHAVPLLVSAVLCLWMTRMTNIIIVPYTSMYRQLFPTWPQWCWLHQPWFYMFDLSTLFRWCQKGKDEHDLVWFSPPSVKLTSLKFSFTHVWYWHIFLLFMVNMVIWFVIIKKEKIVDHILCKVLMITNTIVIVHMFLLEHVIEIGSFALLG